MHTQQQHYGSSDTEEDSEPDAQAYLATRTTGKQTTEARNRATRVPSKPAKKVFDGVYPPPRSGNTGTKPKVTPSAPKTSSSIIPINARKLRNNQDKPMEVDETVPQKVARTITKNAPKHKSATKEKTPKRPGRQSEISKQVKATKTPMTVTLETMLGISPEVSSIL
ncbi:hypothetical protein JR316_0003280 [Psilocybe cubensis]|uniref:Uncharacterized protein n=1 Tax=Psilocybe cubensis TaxID=181762 RepID=A0ACB8H7Y9_PSICU|nr:hypothetical protein JR316_0003280 [Psilocybe cubensis]KAH9483802.1 hypothetical protein JR316_0003280 [Psilocybe cubensis]